MGYITIYKDVEVEVDVTAEDILSQLDEADKKKILEAAGAQSTAFGDGVCTNKERFVEDAYREALRLGAEVPQVFRDLLFYVHGRAIA